MKRTPASLAVLVTLAVILAAILALIIWFATAGLRPNPIAAGDATPTPTSSPTETPTPTATPTATPTPAPTVKPPVVPPVPPPTNPPASDTTAPGKVTALAGTLAPRSVVLSWTNPGDADYASAVIRRALGSTPPASAASGTAVGTVAASGITDAGLTPGAVYSYAVFARDTTGNTSGAATATFTLPVPLTLGTTDTSGAVTQVLPFNATVLSDSGDLEFTAFDTAGTRTASVTALSGSPLGTLTASVVEPVGSTPGEAHWSYSVPNESIRFLGATQTRTETFRVVIGDGTDSVQADVSVVAHGVNDAPTWTADVSVAGITSGQTTQFAASNAWISDPDDEPATYTIVTAPAWLSVDASGTFTASPPLTESGDVTFILSAVDAAGDAATGGNWPGDATQQKFIITANQPPVAYDDAFDWDTRVYPSATFSGNVLSNDTPAGEVAADAATGDFTLTGQTQVAGSYVIYSDGTFDLTPAPIRDTSIDPDDPDYFSAISKLNPGETATIQLPYTVTSAGGSDTGTATITITGRLDPIYAVRQMVGPDQQLLAFNDPIPIVFDATNVFDSPDPFLCLHPETDECADFDEDVSQLSFIQFSWQAQSSVTIPPNPVFLSGTNVKTVTTLNAEWGFNSACTVNVRALPVDGRALAETEITFGVGDGG